LHEEAKSLKEKYPNVLIEGSGGLTEETISQYMSPFVDVLSLGALSQGVPHVDYSLKAERQ
jgi:nicotinate-nucleotide pyrophosphorylase (carboxylating)